MCNAEREAGLLERLPHRRVRRVVEADARCTRSGRAKPADEPEVARCGAPRRPRAAGSCIGQRADAHEPVGRGRAPLGDPVVVDRARLAPRASGRWMPPSLRPSPGYITEMSMPSASSTFTRSCGVEAGGVAGPRSGGRGRSPRSSRPRCRARRDRGRSPSCPRRGTRRSRSPRSSAAGCRGRASTPGGSRSQRSAGSHTCPSASTMYSAWSRSCFPSWTPGSARPGAGVNQHR